MAALALGMAASPASAKLPGPVRAMMDAAMATGDADKVATVAEIARQTNPDDAGEVDAMVDRFTADQQALAERKAAEKEAEIRAAGIFRMWKGKGQIGAFRSTGNDSNTGISASLKLKREGIDWTHKITGRVDYQRSNGVTTREQYLLSYEPNYHITKRLYAYGLEQYEHDRIQGFSGRYSLSGGLGYRVIERDNMKLAVKAGPAWRRTELVNGDTTSSLSGLGALDFEWQVSDTIKFTQDATAYIQTGNSTFTSNTGFEAQLNGHLSARLAYVVEHDTDPPAGAVKTDTLSRFTLIYGF